MVFALHDLDAWSPSGIPLFLPSLQTFILAIEAAKIRLLRKGTLANTLNAQGV